MTSLEGPAGAPRRRLLLRLLDQHLPLPGHQPSEGRRREAASRVAIFLRGDRAARPGRQRVEVRVAPLPPLPPFGASLATSRVAEARGGGVVPARPPRLIRRGILFREATGRSPQPRTGSATCCTLARSAALRCARVRGALQRLLTLLRPVRGGVGCLGETGGMEDGQRQFKTARSTVELGTRLGGNKTRGSEGDAPCAPSPPFSRHPSPPSRHLCEGGMMSSGRPATSSASRRPRDARSSVAKRDRGPDFERNEPASQLSGIRNFSKAAIELFVVDIGGSVHSARAHDKSPTRLPAMSRRRVVALGVEAVVPGRRGGSCPGATARLSRRVARVPRERPVALGDGRDARVGGVAPVGRIGDHQGRGQGVRRVNRRIETGIVSMPGTARCLETTWDHPKTHGDERERMAGRHLVFLRLQRRSRALARVRASAGQRYARRVRHCPSGAPVRPFVVGGVHRHAGAWFEPRLNHRSDVEWSVDAPGADKTGLAGSKAWKCGESSPPCADRRPAGEPREAGRAGERHPRGFSQGAAPRRRRQRRGVATGAGGRGACAGTSQRADVTRSLRPPGDVPGDGSARKKRDRRRCLCARAARRSCATSWARRRRRDAPARRAWARTVTPTRA